jgi:hypothetical protein
MIMIVGCPGVASKELRAVGREASGTTASERRKGGAKEEPRSSWESNTTVSCARQVNAVLYIRCTNGRTIPRNDSMIERRVSSHQEPIAAKVVSRIKKLL